MQSKYIKKAENTLRREVHFPENNDPSLPPDSLTFSYTIVPSEPSPLGARLEHREVVLEGHVVRYGIA